MSSKVLQSTDELRFPSGWLLFLVSMVILFVELLLIRWISTELRVFAYLQNAILVVCFLGLGMGCFSSKDAVRMRDCLLPLTILTLLLAIPVARHSLAFTTQFVAATPEFEYWDKPDLSGATSIVGALTIGSLTTFLLLVLIWDSFVPLGRMLGRLMDLSPRPIRAYSLNVGGSLIGGWLFVLLSAWEQPPFVWMLLAGACLLPLVFALRQDLVVNLCLVSLLIGGGLLAGYEPGAIDVRWSPYQKLALVKTETSNVGVIAVNNTGYQALFDLSEDHVRSDPDRFPSDMRGASQYDIPYRLHPNPEQVLIVGAGSGNDVSGALRHGVDSVTAVEIDPAIIELGRTHHPEQPYSAEHVTVVNDDARAFFASSSDRFDVICFGLLDSHTTGAMTNARLDHYVYTRESIEHVRSLLKEDGLLVLSFEAQRPFIADRMARLLRDVFGKEPLCFRIPESAYGWGGVQFITGDLDQVAAQLAMQPELAGLIDRWQAEQPVPLTYTTPVVTDDWPYIYLDHATIPLPYAIVAGLMLLLYLRGRRQLGRPLVRRTWSRSHWHFFCLGAAFMLLEVQNISKAAVVLGSTWQVNAVIISGILIMILLANALVVRFPELPLFPVYGLLFATCFGLYAFDMGVLAFLPYATRVLLVGAFATLPMLFSGIVFIRAFAVHPSQDEALGANMFGALVGGLSQCLTFLVGVKALLLIVASYYFLAFLTRPRDARRQPEMEGLAGRSSSPAGPPRHSSTQSAPADVLTPAAGRP